MTKFLASTTALAFAALAGSAQANTVTTSGAFGAGELALIEFTLGAGGTYLDLTTNGSNGDTEIALYAGTGSTATYIPSDDLSSGGDDDDGFGLASTLSYGIGSGLTLGNGSNLGGDGIANGEDGGMVDAGIYTLVIGEFSTWFLDGPTIGDITDRGGSPVQYSLTVFSDADVTLADVTPVPLPAAGWLLALGIGALGFGARKRG